MNNLLQLIALTLVMACGDKGDDSGDALIGEENQLEDCEEGASEEREGVMYNCEDGIWVPESEENESEEAGIIGRGGVRFTGASPGTD